MDLEVIFIMTGRKHLDRVQRERLNEITSRWWGCESLNIFINMQGEISRSRFDS